MADFVAQHLYGEPTAMVRHDPAQAYAAGAVIVLGTYPLIAHEGLDPAQRKHPGALAAGGGVYRCVPDAAMTAGTTVYWDASAGEVTETATDNPHFGFTVSASYESDGLVDVLHMPNGSLTAS